MRNWPHWTLKINTFLKCSTFIQRHLHQNSSIFCCFRRPSHLLGQLCWTKQIDWISIKSNNLSSLDWVCCMIIAQLRKLAWVRDESWTVRPLKERTRMKWGNKGKENILPGDSSGAYFVQMLFYSIQHSFDQTSIAPPPLLSLSLVSNTWQQN